MSSLTVLRRGRLAGAVIPALGIAIAGLTVASAGAQAASRNPAHAALHGGPKVALGTTTNVFANVFNEGPDGSLYYSRELSSTASSETASLRRKCTPVQA
jgi:hypothetical protein